MSEVQLFTPRGCHLCEEAELLLLQAAQSLPVTVMAVEISEDPALVERYGIRIPVVRRQDDGRELGWPFDLDGLLQFLG